MEIVSPGGFPPGIGPDNVLDKQEARNPLLAEALVRCGLIERAGHGMNLIYERSIQQSKPLPVFTSTDDYQVFLTLHGTMTDPAFVVFMEKIAEEQRIRLDTKDYLVLDLVHRGEAIPHILRPRAEYLRGHGLVRSVGHGRGARFILGRNFQSEFGDSAISMDPASFDRAACEELLVNRIASRAETGVRFDELQQLLAHISRDRVKALLKKLKAAGTIRTEGERKAARWFPVDSKTHKDGPADTIGQSSR
jgi:ATP-dependent DNA helicase RecG